MLGIHRGVGPQAVAGRVPWIRVSPSARQSENFLGIDSLLFSETQHGVRGPCGVVGDRAAFFFFDPEWGKWAKIGFFQFIGKFSHYFFLNLVNKEVLYYLLYSCRNPILGKNLVLGGQNTPGQSDCMIFKLTTSLEQNDKKTWLFTCWYRFIKIKSWLKNILLCMVKNGCGHAGLRTLKIAVFQEGINEIN